MPTYEYACSSCQHEWELEQSIKDNPITECPSCQKATAKRQISRGTGFILKGGGWYADLYSSSSNSKPSGGSTSGSSGSSGDASGGAKSESSTPSAGSGSSSGSSTSTASAA